MADASLSVTITAHDEATRTLKSIQQEVQGLHGSMNQTGVVAGAVGGIIATGLTSALSALGGAMSAVGGATVGMNSKLEQAGIAFETMLGSGAKAQAFLSELQDFAAKTPFQFPELVEASKRMLAFGFSAEQVRPVLTAVGNAASAMGSGAEGINRITTALGQMKAKGMVQAEEILQLTEAGIPAWDMLAKKLGVDVVTAMDMVTKRTVTADTFLQAFTEGSAARFGDMMEKQSHTFAGAMSTIQDVVGQLIGGSFQPFFIQISKFADELAQGLGADAFKTWATNVQEVLSRLGPLFGQFMEAFKALGPVVQQFVNNNIQGFVAGVQSMGERVLALLPRLGEFAGMVGERLGVAAARLGPVLSTVAELIGKLAEPAGRVLTVLQRLGDAFTGQLATAFSAFAAAAQPVLAWFGQLGTEAARVVEHLGPVFDTIGTLAKRAFDDVGLAVSQVLAIFGPLTITATDVGTTFGKVANQIIRFAHDDAIPALTAFADMAHEAFRNFMEAATTMWVAIQPTLMDLRDWLATNVPTALATLQGVWQTTWDAVSSAASTAWGVIEPPFTQIATWLTDTLPGALTTGQTRWSGFWDAVGPMVNAAWSVVGPVLENIRAWLAEHLPPAIELAQSTWNGLWAEIGPTVTAVWAVIGPLLGQLKDWLGEHIPTAARLMLTVVGGVLKSMVDSFTTLLGALKTVFGPLFDLLGTFGHNANKAIQEGLAGLADAADTPAATMRGKLVSELGLTHTEAKTAAELIGADTMAGITAGLASASPTTEAAIKANVRAMINAAKVEAGIQSPSSVMANQVGAPLAEGIGSGFARAIPAVTSANLNMLKALIQGEADAVKSYIARTTAEIAAIVGPQARQVGGYIMDGIRVGALGYDDSAVTRTITNSLEKSRQDVRAELRASSPSMLWAETVGQPMAEGIGVGWASGFALVQTSMQSGMQQLVASAGDYARRASGAFDTNLVFSGGGDHISDALTGAQGYENKRAAQEMLRIRGGGYTDPNLGAFTPDSYRASQQFRDNQTEWAREHFGTSDLSQMIDPRTGMLLPAASAGSAAGGRTPYRYQSPLDLHPDGGGASGAGLTAGGNSGSGFAQAPLSFAMNFGTVGDQLVRGQGGLQDLAFSVQQSNAAMQAWATALRANEATVASVSGAFTAFAMDLNTAGKSSIQGSWTQATLGGPSGPNTPGPGSGAFQVQGNTAGGANFGALQTLQEQVIRDNPGLSASAQARLIQQGMRTNTEYIKVVGNLTDTSDDLRRQQDEASNELMNLQRAMSSMGSGFASSNGMLGEFDAAMGRLNDATNALAASGALTAAPTPPAQAPWAGTPGGPPPTQPPPGAAAGHWVVGPYGQGWAWLPDSSATTPVTTQITGGIGVSGGSLSGGLLAPTPTTLTVPTAMPAGAAVSIGDINVTVNSSAASTAQEAAELARQVREELRRQGVDVTRLGGV